MCFNCVERRVRPALAIEEIIELYDDKIRPGLDSKDHTRLLCWIMGIFLADEILSIQIGPSRGGADDNRKLKLANEIAYALHTRYGIDIYANSDAIIGRYVPPKSEERG